MDVGLALIQYDFILPRWPMQSPYFQERSHSQIPGLRTLISFGGKQVNPVYKQYPFSYPNYPSWPRFWRAFLLKPLLQSRWPGVHAPYPINQSTQSTNPVGSTGCHQELYKAVLSLPTLQRFWWHLPLGRRSKSEGWGESMGGKRSQVEWLRA